MTVDFDDAGEAARYADYRARQIAEYSTWVAAGPIHVGGALGFVAGHQVPASTVARYGWDTEGLVVPAGTPLPDGDRAEQLRTQLSNLDAHRSALEAELAGVEPAPGEQDQPAVPVQPGEDTSHADAAADTITRRRGGKKEQ